MSRGGGPGGGILKYPPLTFEIFRTPPPLAEGSKNRTPPPLAEGEEKIWKIFKLSVPPRKYRNFFKFSGGKV